MRLLALVAVASLALANPGCTLVGATIGAAIPVTPDSPGDPGQPHHASRGTHALVGAGLGLLVDIIIVSAAVISVRDSLNDILHTNDNCPGCD
jgi:hypothetical protein